MSMSAGAKILMVLTSHGQMGDTGKPTGVWFEELAVPYYALVDAGAQVDIVSVGGGKVPIDPRSVRKEGENAPAVDRFLRDQAAMRKITVSVALNGIDGSRYDAVILPGGHGTMWDLPGNRKLAELIGSMWTAGKVVAAVCHGPAGLVDAVDASGKPIVAGRRVSAFTDEEEEAAGLTRTVPFLLEARLRSLGARFEGGPKFQPFAVTDGNLITGQNPASSALVAQKVLDALGQRASAPAK